MWFTGFHPNVGKTFAALTSTVWKVLKKGISQLKICRKIFCGSLKICENCTTFLSLCGLQYVDVFICRDKISEIAAHNACSKSLQIASCKVLMACKFNFIKVNQDHVLSKQIITHRSYVCTVYMCNKGYNDMYTHNTCFKIEYCTLILL